MKFSFRIALNRWFGLACLLYVFLGTVGCSVSTNQAAKETSGILGSDASVGVDSSELADLVEWWGLGELVALVAEEPSLGKTARVVSHSGIEDEPVRIFLEAIGAPVEAGREGLLAWAETDPVFSSTGTMPETPDSLAGTVEAERMEAWLRAAVGDGISTGYNIVPEKLWPTYDAGRTIIYGHSNIRHARQLLLLLRIHGLHPEFRFVAKTSGFRYREGWGGSTEGLLELSDGGHLVLGEEYDLFLLFDESAGRLRFAEIVSRYAKKNEADQEGLIHGAWWQPFYRTFEPLDSMAEVRMLRVRYKGYRSNIISLMEAAPEKRAELSARFPEMVVDAVPAWVNPSFYRYMGGAFR
jgi:hypothetical protein